jgi:GLPGLI family protein
MKLLLIPLLFCLPTTLLTGQNDSIPFGRILYVQHTDTHGDAQNNGLASLLFNNHTSVYVQHGTPASDTSFSNPEYALPVTIIGDKEGFPVYKLHAERRIFCKIDCRQSRSHCIVSDTFGSIQWVLHPERKRFELYECRRATGVFRGREYEAWYAVDIPVPSGPFKLGGLPGLILEAKSLDGKVKFLFSALELGSNTAGVIRMPTGKWMNMSYTAFIEGELLFIKNFEKEWAAKGVELSAHRDEFIELPEN